MKDSTKLIDLMGEIFNTTDTIIEKDNVKWIKKPDGGIRKIGYREKQKNWLIIMTKNKIQVLKPHINTKKPIIILNPDPSNKYEYKNKSQSINKKWLKIMIKKI